MGAELAGSETKKNTVNNPKNLLTRLKKENQKKTNQDMIHTIKKGFSSGAVHSLIVNEEGELYIWGENTFGQLGQGNISNQSKPCKLKFDSPVKGVACGYYHTLVLLESGDVYSFGANTTGQLGLGDLGNRNSPQKIEALSNLGVVSMACGWTHSMALTESGAVYVWGGPNFGSRWGLEEGDQAIPHKVDLPPIAALSHTLALAVSGEVYMCGDTLGDVKPRKVPELTGLGIISVFSGYDHCLALTRTGEVYAWGNNSFGQLGLGDNNRRNSPTKIDALKGCKIETMGCGYGHSLALTESGEVFGWGYNSSGRLGLGHAKNINLPQKVNFSDDLKCVGVGCGNAHSLFIMENGEIFSGGLNSGGQLGRGHTVDQKPWRLEPVINLPRSNYRWLLSSTFSIRIITSWKHVRLLFVGHEDSVSFLHDLPKEIILDILKLVV